MLCVWPAFCRTTPGEALVFILLPVATHIYLQSAALSYVLAFGSSCNTPPGEILVATALGESLPEQTIINSLLPF